ncbi:MAG: hypothetical protein M3305_17075 [Actinomycetota bacterium]|nr:hypothetical protein [Actinomycetota bacterium]
MRLDGGESISPLDQGIRVLPGVKRDWWNAGAGEVHVFVEANGPGGLRLAELIRNLFGLVQDGETHSKGMPHALLGTILLREFEDVVHFTNPPTSATEAAFIGNASSR